MTDGIGRVELRKIAATLAKLTEQIDKSARDLASPVSSEPIVEPIPPAQSYVPRKAGDSLSMAEALFAERRRRDSVFNQQTYLLGEPAWDILLFLYIGRQRGWAVSVAHAARATGAASTTALRWIARLEGDNMVQREIDPFDRRRVLLRLTDGAASLLDTYVDSLRPIGS
ncbi:hypothetical protein M0208_00520 [Sphingomonas sp. SUN019]|uniref:hypothetical protein n=1 Tax=Sphingomonas sp. SUN019 TaxID=2937788 RepID=UPI0021640882|nr:hypothetical protein [Sphingomonas sp. SUN019]UVO49079.1 hypothetical protein M0208_00520 [Sphingomonas sp. SUN019]